MQKLSSILGSLMIGAKAEAAATLRSCGIDAAGTATISASGTDLIISNDGTNPSGQFKAEKVWNSVWNDIVDFQLACDDIISGKVYFDTFDGAKICTTRCQKSVIGIASDTFGIAVGQGRYHGREVPIAVSGWVLAYVDRIYEPGTALTNCANGNLTEMTSEEKINFPERMVAIYKKPEYDLYFGTDNQKIATNGRHWVKVK